VAESRRRTREALETGNGTASGTLQPPSPSASSPGSRQQGAHPAPNHQMLGNTRHHHGNWSQPGLLGENSRWTSLPPQPPAPASPHPRNAVIISRDSTDSTASSRCAASRSSRKPARPNATRPGTGTTCPALRTSPEAVQQVPQRNVDEIMCHVCSVFLLFHTLSLKIAKNILTRLCRPVDFSLQKEGHGMTSCSVCVCPPSHLPLRQM
jgi:hypothetical protein